MGSRGRTARISPRIRSGGAEPRGAGFAAIVLCHPPRPEPPGTPNESHPFRPASVCRGRPRRHAVRRRRPVRRHRGSERPAGGQRLAAPGDARSLLCRLPQRAAPHGRPRPRHGGPGGRRARCAHLGAGDPQAAGRRDAAPGAAPARPRRRAGPGGVSRDGAGPGRGRRSGSWAHRDVPPPEPGRVPQRGARPAAGRHRRLGPPAGRRRRRARLRQHGGGAVGLADPPRTLSVGGAQDQPPRGGARAAGAEHRNPPHPPPAVSGRPAERGPPVRLARGHRDTPSLSGGRRVLRQAAPAAHLYRLHPGPRHPPAPGRAGRRPARDPVHSRGRRAPRSHRGTGQLRREHPALRTSRLGDLRSRGRRRPPGELPRQGGRAGGRRLVRAQALGNRRRAATPPDRLSPRHQRALAGERGGGQRGDRRAVRGRRPRRHREPPHPLHVPPRPGRRGRCVRAADPGAARPPRLSAPGRGPRRRAAVRVLRAAAADGRLRGRHPARPAAPAHRPRVPVPHRAGPRRRGARTRPIR